MPEQNVTTDTPYPAQTDNPNFPGATSYAGSNMLQNILAYRKAQARQTMLDQLNQQNVQSEIAYRGEMVKSQAENRQSQAADRKAQEEQRILNIYDNGGIPKGADLSGVDPHHLEILKAYRRVMPTDPNPTPSVTTGVSMQPPEGATATPEGDKTPAAALQGPPETPTKTGNFYVGSPAEQIRDRRHAVVAQMMADPTFASASPLEKVMRMGDVYDMKPTASEINDIMKPQQTGIVYDPTSGQWVKPPAGTAAGTPIHVASREPREPQPKGFQYAGTDVSGRPIAMDIGTGGFRVAPVAAAPGETASPGAIQAKPDAAKARGDGITPDLTRELLGAGQNLDKSPEDRGTINTYNGVVSRMIAQSNYAPGVKQLVQTLWKAVNANTALRNMDFDSLTVKNPNFKDSSNPPLSAADIDKARLLWNSVSRKS